MAYEILVVDDDWGHIENVLDACESKGWKAQGALNAIEAEYLLNRNKFDLILLDVNMPGKDGLSYCKELRNRGIRLPILLCTANTSIDDRVEGLENGADDYITKPFALRELCARIEATLRRSSPEKLQVGDLVFDVKSLEVTRAGQVLQLKPTSLKILNELMRQSPNIVRRERLESVVWGGEPPDSDSLRANVYLLRQVVDKPFEKKLILTHTGIGWSIRA